MSGLWKSAGPRLKHIACFKPSEFENIRTPKVQLQMQGSFNIEPIQCDPKTWKLQEKKRKIEVAHYVIMCKQPLLDQQTLK